MATTDLPDARQAFIQQAFASQSAVGCSLTVIDTAGIVQGSHQVSPSALSYSLSHGSFIIMHLLCLCVCSTPQGSGLGNGTLGSLERADVIFHIVRAFDNDTLSHVRYTR